MSVKKEKLKKEDKQVLAVLYFIVLLLFVLVLLSGCASNICDDKICRWVKSKHLTDSEKVFLLKGYCDLNERKASCK